jgi:hypothetical protein
MAVTTNIRQALTVACKRVPSYRYPGYCRHMVDIPGKRPTAVERTEYRQTFCLEDYFLHSLKSLMQRGHFTPKNPSQA